jgi:GNAT superfamily N-acetyltransferase
VISIVSLDEPPERRARPDSGRAYEARTDLSPGDPLVRATLQDWIAATAVLSQRPVSRRTLLKLEDCRRIAAELVDVIDGIEPGEGTADRRRILAVTHRGRLQAIASIFACPRGAFVELLTAAPWNLLAPDDPCDLRTLRGAGSALLEALSARSAARGTGGRLALLAENPRSRERYERLGFRRMTPSDRPLTLVPPGATGHSPSILRLAAGSPGPEEEQSPWMVLEPAAPVPVPAWVPAEAEPQPAA